MTERTGWIYTDAQTFVDCPKCQQPAGQPCITPSGHKAKSPHQRRAQAYVDSLNSLEDYQIIWM